LGVQCVSRRYSYIIVIIVIIIITIIIIIIPIYFAMWAYTRINFK